MTDTQPSAARLGEESIRRHSEKMRQEERQDLDDKLRQCIAYIASELGFPRGKIAEYPNHHGLLGAVVARIGMLRQDAKRWETCERLAVQFNRGSEVRWILNSVPGETFADAIDGEGV